MIKASWDTYFMNLAKEARTRGTCPRKQVGCVIVNGRHHIISTGYNGSPPGSPHCIDTGVGCDMVDGHCKRTIHAEVNAITRTTALQRAGSSLFVTEFPCYDCAKLVAYSGIVEIVYLNTYRNNPDVLDLLHFNSIVVRQYNPE